MTVVYEDNHIIIVNKTASEIVQGDKTGDMPLSDIVKQYIKETYAKPGNVFLGVVHRLDRPVSGLVVFAKTSKALARLNDMFRNGEVKKTYWAIVKDAPESIEGELTHYLVKDEKQNKSYAYNKEKHGAKKAVELVQNIRKAVLSESSHHELVVLRRALIKVTQSLLL